jgi:Ca2+/Na+ antiporter
VVLQRFAIPFGSGQVPVVLPIGLAVVVWALKRGLLEDDRLQVQLYLVAVMVCVAVTCVHAWEGTTWSQLSLIYLVLTYLPFAFRLKHSDSTAFEKGLRLFVSLMTVLAVLGILQMLAQLAGWHYRDPLASLPQSFLLQGYNTNIPIRYAASTYKANGFLFLEPSFFSQFVALALVAQGYLARRVRRAVLFAAALACAFSGTGIILAAVGFALVWMRDDVNRTRFVAAMVVIVAAVAVSPVGAVFSDRVHEFSTANTSAQSRFVTPYRLAADSARSGGSAFFFGNGPGSAERKVLSVATETGNRPVFPATAKLVYEYGAVAACVFLLFVFGVTLRAPPSRRLAAVLLVMYLTLSGSLLQPATVFLLYTFTALFAAHDQRSPAVEPAGRAMAGRRRLRV